MAPKTHTESARESEVGTQPNGRLSTTMTSAVKGLACNLAVLGRDGKRCQNVVAFARRERESRAKGTVQMHGRDVQGQTSSGVVAMPEK